VLVLHERKSRVTLAARLAGKTATETISVMLAVFARIEPALRKSKSRLALFVNNNSVARMRFTFEAVDDGAAQSRSGTVFLEPISKSPEEDNEAGELEVSRPGNFTAGLS
jgi:hypothetical protein